MGKVWSWLRDDSNYRIVAGVCGGVMMFVLALLANMKGPSPLDRLLASSPPAAHGTNSWRASTSKQAYDNGVMLKGWTTPLRWVPGQPPLRIPVSLHGLTFDDYRNFEWLTARPKLSAEEIKADRRLDADAQQVLIDGLDGFQANSKYYAKVGLVQLHDVTDNLKDNFPYLSVTYISEWERKVFSQAMATDFHQHKGDTYAKQRAAWFGKTKIEFPSVLFSEFILITQDGSAVVTRKGRDDHAGSVLVKALQADLWSASAETSVRGGTGGDLEPGPRPDSAFINVNQTIRRGLADVGLQPEDFDRVSKVGIHGVAFQEDTMSSSLLGIVHIAMTCPDIVARNQAQGRSHIECLPFAAADELINTATPTRHWHPTARLRMHAWVHALNQPAH